MLTGADFEKKQIAFIFFQEGEKLAFSNDNLIIKTAEDKVKFQCTCYRLYIVYAVGNCSITSVLLQKAQKFGFFIVFMTSGFRVYGTFGAAKEGNTLLKQKQYQYSGLELAKHIICNKIQNQRLMINNVRQKSEAQKEAIALLDGYALQVRQTAELQQLMAYEGLASRTYFKNYFNTFHWSGRHPRVKNDIPNALLDIGYTLLFSFVDSVLCSFGFDTYLGIMHRQFYLRKSLVCDLVEPFRPLMDRQLRKMFNLKQVHEDDFLLSNGQYRLKWEKSPSYIQALMQPILTFKTDIFLFLQAYYRAFMKNLPADKFPIFTVKEENK